MLTRLLRVIMAANTAGIYGAQIFRQDDKPKYRRGFSINLGVLSFGLSLAILRKVDEFLQKRKARQLGIETHGAEQVSNDEEFEKAIAAKPSDEQPQPVIVSTKN